MTSSLLSARVVRLRYEAQGITSVQLRPVQSGQTWPAAEAGAHIDLHLAPGLVRSYSLVHPDSREGYTIAVLRDRHSRGGSQYVHEQLRVGQVIEISAPRNHFRLDESAAHSVLLAGGIGITPLYAMLQRLWVLRRSVDMVYCARRRDEAAYVDDLQALAEQAVGQGLAWTLTLHFDEEQGGPPRLTELLAGHARDTPLYCCGPAPMLDAFEQACEALGYTQVHMERFAAPPPRTTATQSEPAGTVSIPQPACTVELRKSGITLDIAPDVPVLDALLEAGLTPEFSCREGICGACETRVISGDVEHLDHILTRQEQAANRSMMICVSRCRTGTLVLDA